MAITGLDHINIATDRLAETRAFFIEGLGLEEGDRPDFGIDGAWLYRGGKAVVHLVAAGAPRAPSAGAALDHFAFSIDDWEASVERLAKLGIAFRTSDVPGRAVRQIFLNDPNGVTIELNWSGSGEAR